MRIIVLSDSHGSYSALEKVILRNTDADWIFHLGDGESELDRFLSSHPELAPKIIHVAGNCDYNSRSRSCFILPLPGHKIFACHGHKYGVNFSLDNIKSTAIENGCDIILFGHTHVRFNKYEDGFYILNPGSAALPRDNTKPSFGVLTVLPQGVVTNIADIPNN